MEPERRRRVPARPGRKAFGQLQPENPREDQGGRSQVIPARPTTDYFVHAWIRSDDRVVLRAGRGAMAYTGAGEWQKISGLVRTGAETNLTLQIQLGVRPGAGGTMWVDDVEVKPAALPELGLRPLHGATALVEQGQPAASIVYPAGIPAYREFAEKVQKSIARITGATLPLLTDAEATEKDAPILKASCRDRHLILLGRLGINRAMWPAYNRFLDGTDGYYPGADGYVVRDAVTALEDGQFMFNIFRLAGGLALSGPSASRSHHGRQHRSGRRGGPGRRRFRSWPPPPRFPPGTNCNCFSPPVTACCASSNGRTAWKT